MPWISFCYFNDLWPTGDLAWYGYAGFWAEIAERSIHLASCNGATTRLLQRLVSDKLDVF